MKKTSLHYLLAEIVLAVILILAILLLLIDDFRLFFSLFYSPFSFLLLVVILIEYIILKSMDRSRIYKLELERLKIKRDKDLAFQQSLESQIKNIYRELDIGFDKEELQRRLKKIIHSFRRF
jgi:hypothetical protein